MRAVALVLRVRLRQHWKSWLALAALVALVGGFVMAAAVTGRRTAAALPDFTARHGYDALVYSGQPLPGLARFPQVARVTPVLAPFASRAAACPAASQIDSCRHLLGLRSPAGQPVPGGQTALGADAGPVQPR